MIRTLSRSPNAMSVPATTITFYPLRRYDSPQTFLGAGFVAGLLLFCAWLWSQPDNDRHAPRPRGNGEIAAGVAGPGAGGVLNGITGAGGRGADFISSGDAGSSFFAEAGEGDEAASDAQESVDEAYLAGESDVDGDSMAVGEDVGAPPPMEEGAALTDRLLDTPPATLADPDAGPPGAPLLPYFVEVEIAPGQVQQLQLNAESPEHALQILRDFRGDPRVLRGPSTEPLQ
jgi:hypothetical protein